MRILLLILFSFLLLSIQNLGQGNFWELRNGPQGPLKTLSFASNSTGYTFAGTFEDGIFYSLDDGNNWSSCNNGLTNLYINYLLINISGNIFAGTNGDGIFRSTDNGQNWVAVNSGLTNLKVRCITNNSQGDLFIGAHNNNVYKSTNNGDDWIQITSNLPASQVKTLIVLSNDDILAGLDWEGVFRSTNAGTSWIQTGTGLPAGYLNNFALDEAGNLYLSCSSNGLFKSTDNGNTWFSTNITLNTVYAVITNGNIVIASGDGIRVSDDNGSTWYPPTGGLIGDYYFALGKDNEGHILVRSRIGEIYHSSNNGFNWNQLNKEITDLSIYTILTTSDGKYFASTQDGGVFRSTNIGENWQLVFGDRRITSFLEGSTGSIFMGTWSGEFWKSLDGGVNWVQLGSLPESVWSLAFDSNGNLFAATANGLYKSTDDGTTWIFAGLVSVSSVMIMNGNIFAGSIGNGIYRATNGGNNWTLLNNGLTNLGVVSMTYNSSGYLYAASSGGSTGYTPLFLSTNNGDDWTRIDQDFEYDNNPVVLVNSIDEVYVGLSSLVMKTTDNGQTWDSVGTGFSNGDIFDLNIDMNGYLIAGVFGSGVWRSVNSTTSVESLDLPEQFTLFQNYPNPFNPSTKIKFSIPEQDIIQIKVFDVLGKEIKTILNDYRKSGTYEVDFDASNLPSGVYFYRIISGSYAETKKMLLLR